MPRDLGDLDRDLKDLGSRLDRIEARLGIPKRVVAPPQVEVPPVVPVPPPQVTQQGAMPPALPPTAGASWEERSKHLEELARRRVAALAASRGEHPAEGAPPVAPPVAGGGGHPPIPMSQPRPMPAMQVRDKHSFTLEQLVGGKLFAVVGGLIVAIGLAMFLKLGIDKGWFTFPPAYRCIGGGLFGLLLMGTGEFVRRKLGAAGTLVGAGIAGAGLAAIYGSAFAAYGLYNIIQAPAAFALLALISVFGIGVALQAKSLPLGVLALIGAYINPLLMGRHQSPPLVMPSYLIALLVLGLGLSAWRPIPFRRLRSVAWWGTAIVGLIWIFPAGGSDHPLIVLSFLGLVWLLVHGELFFGSRRVSEAAGPPGVFAFLRAARPMISSFATTIWSVGVGVLVIHFTKSQLRLEDWYVSAAGLVGTGALAMVLAGNLRAFRDPPETDAERLGVALWTQAGSLLITTVALALSDWTQVVAWLSMGLAAMGAGRWARAKGLEGYGLVVLGIAAVRLIVWDSWNYGGAAQPLMGLMLTQWTLLMAIGGAAWGSAAWMLWRPSGVSDAPSVRRAAVSNICVGIAITLTAIGFLSFKAQPVPMGAVGGVWGLAMLIAARLRSSSILRYWGIIGFCAISLVVCIVHIGGFEYIPWQIALGPVLLTDWSMVLFGFGAVWMIGAALGRGTQAMVDRAGAIGSIAMGVAMVLMGTVVKDTSQGAVCVLWVGVGLALVIAHTCWRRFAMDVMAMGVYVLAGLLWTMAYVVDPKQNWLRVMDAPFAYPGLWVALAIVTGMFGSTAWLSRGEPRRATWMNGVNLLRGIAGVLLFASTSLEVSRSAGIQFPSDHTAQAAAVTIWWGLFGVGMLTAGFLASVPVVRHIGLGLVFVATVKALFLDTIEVRPEWRVASFLTLGPLMLGVAVVYAWLDRKARAAEKAAVTPPMSVP